MLHFFVINPRSFPKKQDLEAVLAQIKSCFKNRDDDTDYAVYVSKFPRDALGAVHLRMQEIPPDKKMRVYAVGGDGILFDCLNGIVGFSNAELVSVPYGKTNDYIRSFGENKHRLFRDINALVNTTETIPTDLMYYGNNYAINDCSIGLESTAIIKMNALNKKYRKYLNRFPFLYSSLFLLSGLAALFDQELIRQHYDITIDGEDYSGNYLTINIANGPCYGGDMCAVPTAVPDDGYLDVNLVYSSPSLTILRFIKKYLSGRLPRKYYTCKRAKKISIRSGKPLLIQMDGDILIDTNITLEVVPAAVSMVTPNGLRYERRLPFDA